MTAVPLRDVSSPATAPAAPKRRLPFSRRDGHRGRSRLRGRRSGGGLYRPAQVHRLDRRGLCRGRQRDHRPSGSRPRRPGLGQAKPGREARRSAGGRSIRKNSTPGSARRQRILPTRKRGSRPRRLPSTPNRLRKPWPPPTSAPPTRRSRPRMPSGSAPTPTSRGFSKPWSPGAVSRHEAELAQATALSARSDAQHSRAILAVSRSQSAATVAKRASLKANLAAAEAAVGRAQAALDLARQDQGHAVIRAPIDGVVGDRQVQAGDYLNPGTRLMTVRADERALCHRQFQGDPGCADAGRSDREDRGRRPGRQGSGRPRRKLRTRHRIAILPAAVRTRYGKLHQGSSSACR